MGEVILTDIVDPNVEVETVVDQQLNNELEPNNTNEKTSYGISQQEMTVAEGRQVVSATTDSQIKSNTASDNVSSRQWM